MTKAIKTAAFTAVAGLSALLALEAARAGAEANPSPGSASANAQATNSNSSSASSSSQAESFQAVKQQPDGMWVDKNGTPTFKVGPDGTVDWYTYEGYIQYSANCLQCHGPDGLGSSYAPNLVNALKTMSYPDFYATVAGGKKSVSSAQELVMPAFGVNKNVMCYINPIYVYLRARAEGAVGRGRPEKHAPVPPAFNKQVDSCMG